MDEPIEDENGCIVVDCGVLCCTQFYRAALAEVGVEVGVEVEVEVGVAAEVASKAFTSKSK